MAQQFDLDGPSALSITFYAGFQGAQMVEITARQAYVERAQLRITLHELLALLNRAEIREETERRASLLCCAQKDSFICNRPVGHPGDHWHQNYASGGRIGWSRNYDS